jgi:hypothetical protein
MGQSASLPQGVARFAKIEQLDRNLLAAGQYRFL